MSFEFTAVGILFFFVFKKRQTASISVPLLPSPAINVTWRSDNVLGVYRGTKILDKIRLEDGRNFAFESIAVASQPGIYHADGVGTYIVVDECLLYREIVTV